MSTNSNVVQFSFLAQNAGTPCSNWLGIPADKMAIVREAIAIIDQYNNPSKRTHISSPRDCGEYFKLKLGLLPYEVFAIAYLDNRHGVIGFEELFRGTVDGASIHPREVVRACIERNAVAVVLAHNHPSGSPEPSAADRAITRELRNALDLVGVRVLDHLIIGHGTPVSLAERGLI